MSGRSILFLQATEPGAYPPIMNAAFCLADRGWWATLLAAPMVDLPTPVPAHPGVTVKAIATRPSHVFRPSDYARYHLAAARLALTLRPAVVYASDPLAASPALLAARLTGAKLVYHEHDSPRPGGLRPWLAARRRSLAERAEIVVLPNSERAELVRAELGLPAGRMRTVWNVPRLAEVPPALPRPDAAGPLVLYYHGSITPDRVPKAVVTAVIALDGLVRLRVVGYEAPGATGYIRQLRDVADSAGRAALVEFPGAVDRSSAIAEATRADIGLALVPPDTDDINLANMAGASNKAFDYMAAGLALIVTDRPDWRTIVVAPGYGVGCDPRDPASISNAVRLLAQDRGRLRAMGNAARARIAAEWHYERAFAPVVDALGAAE